MADEQVKKRLFWFLVFWVYLLPLAYAQQRQVDFKELERVALEELKETNTPGAAIAVISGERVVYTKGLGISNIETGAPVTADLLFQIGSLTKMMTAAVLTSLSEQGKIDLNAPIDNTIKGLSPAIAKITAHQLLSQTSGMRDMEGGAGSQEESALAAYARSYKDEDPLNDSGKFFSYSNNGYALAGLLIETIGGKPYADVMDEILFKPLGMNRTTFRPMLAMTYPLALGHNPATKDKPATVIRPMDNDTRIWPAGYAFSNLNNYSRFIIALLNGGKIDGRQIIPDAAVSKMLTPYISIPTNVFENGKYGYGFFLHDYRGLRVAEHGGTMPGFSCMVRMVPEQRFAIIVFTNQDHWRLEKTINKAFVLMLPVKPSVEAQPKTPQPMSETEMGSYVGTYSNRWTMEVFMKNGKLYLKRFNDEMPMNKIGENRFSVTPSGTSLVQEFTIMPNADGVPKYMQMFIWTFKKSQR